MRKAVSTPVFAPAIVALILSTFASVGCYEETGSPPQAQTPAPPVQEGPITSMGKQPASSALGKAKRTAGNIADEAERKSREVADQADEMMNPKSPKPNSEEPADNPD